MSDDDQASQIDTIINRPHAKYAATDGLPIKSTSRGIPLNPTTSSTVLLKKGILNGQPIAYIVKLWNVWSKLRDGLIEAFLLTKEDRLRPLQGDVVPQVIGVYSAPGGFLSLTMEPVHPIRWREADSSISQSQKDAILAAYGKIHAQGVLHGDPALRHMLIGEDSKVTIVDFRRAQCLEPNDTVGLQQCYPLSFQEELRAVKFILDYPGAKVTEYDRLDKKTAIDTANSIRRRMKENLTVFTNTEDQLTYITSELTSHGLQGLDEEEYPDDLISNPPFSPEKLRLWDAGTNGSGIEDGKRFKVPLEYRCQFRHPLKTDGKPANSQRVPEASRSVGNTPDTGLRKKRSYDEIDDSTTIHPKKSKRKVKFHPDTLDNWFWATNRCLRRSSPLPGPSRPQSPQQVESLLSHYPPPRPSTGFRDAETSSEASVLSSPPPTMPDMDCPQTSPPPEMRLAASADSEPDTLIENTAAEERKLGDRANRVSALSSLSPFVTPEPEEVLSFFTKAIGPYSRTLVPRRHPADDEEEGMDNLSNWQPPLREAEAEEARPDHSGDKLLLDEMQRNLEPRVARALQRWMQLQCTKAWQLGFERGVEAERNNRSEVARPATVQGSGSEVTKHTGSTTPIMKVLKARTTSPREWGTIVQVGQERLPDAVDTQENSASTTEGAKKDNWLLVDFDGQNS